MIQICYASNPGQPSELCMFRNGCENYIRLLENFKAIYDDKMEVKEVKFKNGAIKGECANIEPVK